MIKVTLVLATVLVAAPVWAQKVDINEIDTTQENTTIEIRKGKQPEVKPGEPLWEITDGDADLEGEPTATAKEARTAWNKACQDWKKEIREDNKENKILALNCGTPACGGEAGNKTCTSKAKFKLKTRLN